MLQGEGCRARRPSEQTNIPQLSSLHALAVFAPARQLCTPKSKFWLPSPTRLRLLSDIV